VLISVRIERRDPVAGTAAIEGSEPLRFEGWLALLRVCSELVTTAPLAGGDADATERADAGTSDRA
jgi:hypothetical protein